MHANISNSAYAEPINNTIFERKHHFMYILKEAEILKSQINEEVVYGSIEASRLDEINSICNLAFASLIREGLAYRYERDTNPEKDTFVITVDHTDYRCRAQILKNILKDKFPGTQNNVAHYSSSVQTPVVVPFEQPSVSYTQAVVTPPAKEPEYAPDKQAKNYDAVNVTPPVMTAVVIESIPEPEIAPAVPSSWDSTPESPAPKKTSQESGEEMPEVQFGNLEPSAAQNETSESELQKDESKEMDSMLNAFMADLLNDPDDADSQSQESKLPEPQGVISDEKTSADISSEKTTSENDIPEEESPTSNAHLSGNSDFEASSAQTTSVNNDENELEEKPTFEVIGSGPVTKPGAEIHLIDEAEMHKDAFVYQTIRANIRHEGSNQIEDIYFMVAPLEIKKDEISTKIMVYAYLHGRAYAQCSLQNKDARNTISFAVGEYDFLVRGIFEDYNFSATIIPTGITEKQNDVLTILETVTHAPKQLTDAQNGHIKFSYDAGEERTGLIEVFPTGFDNDSFVILRQYGEWVDVLRTEEDKTLTQTSDGLQELVCLWEGDALKAEFVPAY